MPNSIQQFDTEFKKSPKYKEWLEAARAQFPLLPDSLIDLAICAHMGDPLAYRNNKNKTPTTIPKSSTEEVVINAVTIEPPSESSITIEQVEAEAHPPVSNTDGFMNNTITVE